MTPDELRDGARALYLRFAEQLQLKPWRPSGWCILCLSAVANGRSRSVRPSTPSSTLASG